MKKYFWIILLGYFIIAWIYPAIGSIAFICMLAPLIIAVFKKRTWCGTYCPRGSLSDSAISKVSLNKSYPKTFKALWFHILFLTVILTFFSVSLIRAKNLAEIGATFFRMILATTLISIILGIIYKPRAWCMFCPMGTIATFIIKIKRKL